MLVQLESHNGDIGMVKMQRSFGERVRKKRMEKQITLRKFAELVGVSPTYVSQIERDEFEPPAEDKIRKIAEILGEDQDEMLALANKVSGDLSPIIRRHPKEVATFLRTAKGFSREEWEALIAKVQKQTGKRDDH